MEYFKIVVMVVGIVSMGCLQGFINFDFKELDVFISFAFPVLFSYCLYVERLKSGHNNQGKGT